MAFGGDVSRLRASSRDLQATGIEQFSYQPYKRTHENANTSVFLEFVDAFEHSFLCRPRFNWIDTSRVVNRQIEGRRCDAHWIA